MSSGAPPMTRALGFGAIGLCGSDVTLISKHVLMQDPGVMGVLPVFAVPCSIAGILMVKTCGAKIWHSTHQPRMEEALT